MKKIVLMLIVAALALPSYAYVIGNWENGSDDGWIDWNNGYSIYDANYNTNYTAVTTRGITRGQSSLLMGGIAGWDQTLAIKLNGEQRVAFMANSFFAIDVTVRPGIVDDSGWNEVYALSLNAEGMSWTDIGGQPLVHFDFWSESPVRKATIYIDYSAYKASITATETTGYIELILATNSDGVHNTLYFDNARLLAPEPATIALLGLGLTLLRKRS